jgi:hypothetical protein
MRIFKSNSISFHIYSGREYIEDGGGTMDDGPELLVSYCLLLDRQLNSSYIYS